ncbi:MAG: hypothetical protein H7333_02305 [Bdellovibrionales bacterium]|nr:hypothetical protein [Oligoflexia bacterium]
MKKLGFGLSLLLTSAFPNAVFAQSNIVASSQSVQASLGNGYNPHTQTFQGTCMSLHDSDIEWVGQQTATVQFDRSMSSEEARDSLGFGAKARAKFGVYTASAAAQFARGTSSDDYSESATYSAVVHFKNAKVKNPVLSTVARARANIASQFRDTCGTEYVEQIEYGAALYVNLKVRFSTREDHESFAAQASLSGPMFSASAELQKASSKFVKTGYVSVSLLQLGGDVTKLATIFDNAAGPKSESISPTSDSPIAIVNCSMSDLSSCNAVLSAAIKYASNDLKFPSQISPSAVVSNAQNGPAALHYLTKNWVTAGITTPTVIEDSAAEHAKQQLSALLDDQLKISALLDSVKIAHIRLSAAQRNRVTRTRESLNHNIGQIINQADVCYTDSNKCMIVLSELQGTTGKLGSLRAITAEDLTILPETFAQYCDLRKSQYSSYRTDNTVNALLQIAQKQMDSDIYEAALDQCAVAESLLMPLNQISIPFKKITNLGPLRNLVNLKRLYLNANPIDSLEAISSLSKLEVLDLDQTKVTDLSAISSLRSLRMLYLNGTRTLGLEKKIELQFPETKVAFDSNSVCHLERYTLLMDRLISKDQYDDFESSNSSPVYSDQGVREEGINYFGSCAKVSFFL